MKDRTTATQDSLPPSIPHLCQRTGQHPVYRLGRGVFPAAGQGQCLGAQQHCLQPGLQGQRCRWAAGTGGDRGQSRGQSPGTSLMVGAEQGFSGQRLEGWEPPHHPTEPGGALLDLRSGLCLPSWQTPCLLWAPALSPVSEDSAFSGWSRE